VEMGQCLQMSQRQTVTQRMVQTVSVLGMSADELQAYLEEKSLENPVIICDAEQENLPRKPNDMEMHREEEWLAGGYCLKSRRDREGEDTEPEMPEASGRESLAEHLQFQLLDGDYTAKEREILCFLTEDLDSRGYFRDDTGRVAQLFSVSRSCVEQLLAEIRMLDPAGVGASSLEECLRLQLEARGRRDSLAFRLCERRWLRLLAGNRMREVAEKNHVSLREALEAYGEIRELNPLPGNAWGGGDEPVYIRPDALIVRSDKGWTAIMAGNCRPAIRTDPYYRKLMETTGDPELKAYLRKKTAEAEELRRDIQNREHTVKAVLDLLTERQEEFFKKGPGHRNPLTLEELAEEAGVHVSTVSRVLRRKYLQCAWGVYPLRYFLAGTAVRNRKTGDAQTRDAVQNVLVEIIRLEDKGDPYSDLVLTQKLKERGICVSRRTVNKYRTLMGIPDRAGRKIWQIPASEERKVSGM
jgi:RNA polymerase sigma-54 factor